MDGRHTKVIICHGMNMSTVFLKLLRCRAQLRKVQNKTQGAPWAHDTTVQPAMAGSCGTPLKRAESPRCSGDFPSILANRGPSARHFLPSIHPALTDWASECRPIGPIRRPHRDVYTRPDCGPGFGKWQDLRTSGFALIGDAPNRRTQTKPGRFQEAKQSRKKL